MVGQVKWELIEPLDEESVYARFLAVKGEGVHHITVTTPSFENAVGEQVNRGNNLLLDGTFSGAKVAYLPTDSDLGVIIEIFSSTSNKNSENLNEQSAYHLKKGECPLSGMEIGVYRANLKDEFFRIPSVLSH